MLKEKTNHPGSFSAAPITAAAIFIICSLLLLPGSSYSKAHKLCSVRSVSFSKGKNSEKVMVQLDREISYRAVFLDRNTAKKRPYRLFVDMLKTRFPSGIKSRYYPEGSNIKKIRIAQSKPNTTRIVLEFKHKIFRENYDW